MIKKPAALITFMLFFSGVFFKALAANAPDDNFLVSINNQGAGESFEQAILLKDLADYSGCNTIDCAQRVFNQAVFGYELQYVAEQFGRRRRDWDVSGQSEVSSYEAGFSRYYDDLSIQEFSTGKIHVLHFDITNAIEALNTKEFAIDPSSVTGDWGPDDFY